MKAKTGWVEKSKNGRMISMVQVLFRRVKPKKTPRKSKGKLVNPLPVNEDLYYVLDKKMNFGQLELTGDSVFNKGEVIEIEFQVAHFNARLRMLAKILKVSSFLELKNVLFRGELKFAAVNKEDYDQIIVMEADRLKRLEMDRSGTPPQAPQEKRGTLKLTFKQS